MSGDLVRALADLKEKEALEMVEQRLGQGDAPLTILSDARRGMEMVGRRFEKGEYFIPDLVYSGEIMKEIVELLKPELPEVVEAPRLGTVVMGTVAGDIHDIGKNIVTSMLDINGFEVYDLGVDVPQQKFVEKIRDTKASIVGLSGFMTTVHDAIKETVRAIESAGLRDKVKIMVGGGMVDERISKYTGADGYGKDATVAVSMAKRWLGGE
jgi:5-methyltetrahydrofolate--homocysteine methyltransferase